MWRWRSGPGPNVLPPEHLQQLRLHFLQHLYSDSREEQMQRDGSQGWMKEESNVHKVLVVHNVCGGFVGGF